MTLPIPPIELRRSMGMEAEAASDNPDERLAFCAEMPAANYKRVLDFGCGCGRTARHLLLQNAGDIPERYLGLDLYRPSIRWASLNLVRKGFEFRHLDVWSAGFNPTGAKHVDFGTDETFTLINAHSVFTHIVEESLSYYFEQCARRLAANGILRTTWFFFDKKNFPMMQEFQNALYINPQDLSNAVIYDAEFVRGIFKAHGLSIYAAQPPQVRGHQWLLHAKQSDEPHVEFAPDLAPTGLVRPPVSING